MAIPDPATTNWVPIWNPLSTGPAGPQGPPGPTGPSTGPHAPTHYNGAGDPVDIKLLAGYNGATDQYLRGDGTFAIIPGITGVALLAQPNTFTGVNTFNASVVINSDFRIVTTAPYVFFRESDQPLDGRDSMLVVDSGMLQWQQRTDAGAVIRTPFAISRAGQTIAGDGSGIANLNATNLAIGTVADARLSANVPLKNVVNQFTNPQRISNAANPTGNYARVTFTNVNGPADSKTFEINVDHSGGTLNFWSLNDAESGVQAAMSFARGGVLTANGAQVSNLNAGYLAAGTVPLARLGTNGPSGSTYLRGDNTWQTISGIPAGLIAIFDTACPVGWTRVAALDNRFPIGSTGWGSAGGASQHTHRVRGNTSNIGDHSHSASLSGSSAVSGSGSTSAPSGVQNADAGGSFGAANSGHTHTFFANLSGTADVSGNTNNAGGHGHSFDVNADDANHMPPYLTVVYCRKD